LKLRWTSSASGSSEIDEKIENLDVSAADIAQKAAAIHMITNCYLHLAKNPMGEVAVLEALRPMLRGLIREHADFAAKDWNAPIGTMPFWAAA
jgi:hypothetical protein